MTPNDSTASQGTGSVRQTPTAPPPPSTDDRVEEHAPTLQPDEARQGEMPHVVRYVLAFSLLAALIAMIVVATWSDTPA